MRSTVTEKSIFFKAYFWCTIRQFYCKGETIQSHIVVNEHELLWTMKFNKHGWRGMITCNYLYRDWFKNHQYKQQSEHKKTIIGLILINNRTRLAGCVYLTHSSWGMSIPYRLAVKCGWLWFIERQLQGLHCLLVYNTGYSRQKTSETTWWVSVRSHYRLPQPVCFHSTLEEKTNIAFCIWSIHRKKSTLLKSQME